MQSYYADFHIHIGRTESGRPVKISGSRNLTFFNIVREAADRKGMDMIGLIDCHVPEVQAEIDRYIKSGVLQELPGGGFGYRGMCIIAGTEMELREPEGKPFHVLVYFPTLEAIADFTTWITPHMKNVTLSSQRLYVPARELQVEVKARGGLFIPAHIFTPFKSVYGSAASRMEDVLDPDLVSAVELGLSADTNMAARLSELDSYSFLTNSDAHSLSKIAREYNRLRLQTPDFHEWQRALATRDGRCIEANYGLDPRLGKYHRVYCRTCDTALAPTETHDTCPKCGSAKLTRGVERRIDELADRHQVENIAALRPPYFHQVPLEYIPGVGRRTLESLLQHFGTEMDILHRVKIEDLAKIAGERIASYIAQGRAGSLHFTAGGGGKYGKVVAQPPHQRQ